MVKIAITLNGIVRNIAPRLSQFIEQDEIIQQTHRELGIEEYNSLDADILEKHPDVEGEKNILIEDLIPLDQIKGNAPCYLDFYNTPTDLHYDVYNDNAFDIFGLAPLKYDGAMNDLNEFYQLLTEIGSCTILSEERDNSKAGTLYFLAMNKCKCNNFKWVYSYEIVAQDFDYIITANPFLYEKAIEHEKHVVLIKDQINEHLNVEKIESLKETIEKTKNNG